MDFTPFFEFTETHPAHHLFQLVMLEKETGLSVEKTKFGEFLLKNDKSSKHGLAILMDGVTLKVTNGELKIASEPKDLGSNNASDKPIEEASGDNESSGVSELSRDEPQGSLEDTSDGQETNS